jgi:putative flippase GtrA
MVGRFGRRGYRSRVQSLPLGRLRPLAHEVAKFGVVGFANLVLDVGLFNVLIFTVAGHAPLTAKAVSSTVAATSSYFMNRHWTWVGRARTGLSRELPLFLLLSAVGLGITEACLAVSHYGLDLTSRLADNVAANVIGLVLATAWRFLSFKRWVFLPPVPEIRVRTPEPEPAPALD